MNHENYQTIRSNVIDMVLATELGKHFEHVNKFISSTRVADEAVLDGSGRSPRQSTISLNNQTNSDNNEDAELRTLVKRVLIKVAGRLTIDRYFAQKSICFSLLLLTPCLQLLQTSYNYNVLDVSNPARPREACIEWTRRICEEYFEQTAEESDKGLPIVMPVS